MEVIRATSLSCFPELVGDLGADADAILRQSGIQPGDAGRPDVFVGLRGAIRALETAAVLTGTPDLGRRLADRQGIEILGPLGVAARTAPTLAEALVIFDKFMGAYSPGLQVQLLAQPDPQRWFFEYRVLLEPVPPQSQTVELSLGITLRVLRLLLGPDFAPLSVHIPHSPLTAPGDYQKYYGCRSLFGQPAAGFTIRAVDVQRPLNQDPLTHQSAMGYLTTLLADRRRTMAQSVGDIVRHLLPTGTATVDRVAQQFALHPKALQRRLAAEGATFSSVVDGVRREIAQRCLRDTDITLDHLTRQLGYAEQSVLTRACQRWFGVSPTDYRAATRIGVDTLPALGATRRR